MWRKSPTSCSKLLFNLLAFSSFNYLSSWSMFSFSPFVHLLHSSANNCLPYNMAFAIVLDGGCDGAPLVGDVLHMSKNHLRVLMCTRCTTLTRVVPSLRLLNSATFSSLQHILWELSIRLIAFAMSMVSTSEAWSLNRQRIERTTASGTTSLVLCVMTNQRVFTMKAQHLPVERKTQNDECTMQVSEVHISV